MADRTTWRSDALGPARQIDVGHGPLRVHEAGTGAPIVFVHGLLVNANLWRKVVTRLAPDFRCLALDLPLGSHVVPVRPDADLTPTGLADLIADALEALDLHEVTLVGNDTGGALSQILVTRRPERIGRLVLTSCDAFDNFPPKMFRPLQVVARIPGAIPTFFAPLRLRPPRRLPFAFGWLSKRPIDREAEDSYTLPALTNKEIRRDVRRALPAIKPRYTLDAAERLPSFAKPALIAWSSEDRFFPVDHGRRLATLLPNARLELIEAARTFSPEDQPDRLAELIAAFAREPAAQRAAA